ncbi:hypothetical protein A2U01_0094547, partial [Trifolium medium]|nr:hypothetical protein [Trifolium medium]
MNRNEAVLYEQYEAHMKAQEEQMAAASASLLLLAVFLRSSLSVSLEWMIPVNSTTSWIVPPLVED